MKATQVFYDAARRQWVVEYGRSDRQEHFSTADAAWERSGLPRPPGKMPVTDKDWE